MARLIVNALSEDTVAAPGNRLRNYIVVSVTDNAGKPVSALGAANFKVDPVIVGPGGSLVNITGVTAGRLPGTYIVFVVPIAAQTWKSGVYIFAVSVTSGINNGQNLCSVMMD
ncbi:MAG: hypothetical protein JST02_03995 [Bacteroidetes bacterium]|nr:hypothetical protein [Bacteroidota bacterium]